MKTKKERRLALRRLQSLNSWLLFVLFFVALVRVFIVDERIVGWSLVILSVGIFLCFEIYRKLHRAISPQSKENHIVSVKVTTGAILSVLSYFVGGLAVIGGVSHWKCVDGEITYVWSRRGHGYGTFRSSQIEEDIEISANLLDPWSWKLPPFDVGTKISVVFGNSKIGDLLVVRSVKEAGSCNPEKLEK